MSLQIFFSPKFYTIKQFQLKYQQFFFLFVKVGKFIIKLYGKEKKERKMYIIRVFLKKKLMNGKEKGRFALPDTKTTWKLKHRAPWHWCKDKH